MNSRPKLGEIEREKLERKTIGGSTLHHPYLRHASLDRAAFYGYIVLPPVLHNLTGGICKIVFLEKSSSEMFWKNTLQDSLGSWPLSPSSTVDHASFGVCGVI